MGVGHRLMMLLLDGVDSTLIKFLLDGISPVLYHTYKHSQADQINRPLPPDVGAADQHNVENQKYTAVK